MSRHAFIVGGTGQIGRAVAADLLEHGWRVTVAHRGIRPLPNDLVERSAKIVILDRGKPEMVPGMGSGPGMKCPAFGGPPLPPICQQVLAMRNETTTNAAAIRAVSEKAKPPHPAATCGLFKVYLGSERKFIEGLRTNAQTCGVPAEVIKRAQDGYGKASEIGKQVCEAAEHAPPATMYDPYDGMFFR
jgi:NAD(P)-dependent dehydrogenase (short-subunit alcohol dehydrogenase family)